MDKNGGRKIRSLYTTRVVRGRDCDYKLWMGPVGGICDY